MFLEQTVSHSCTWTAGESGEPKGRCVPKKGRDEHCWMLVQYSQELGDLDVTVMSWSGGNCS